MVNLFKPLEQYFTLGGGPQQGSQEANIVLNGDGNAGVLHFDREIVPLMRPGGMHLAEACGGKGAGVKRGKNLLRRRPQFLDQGFSDQSAIEWRYLMVGLGKLPLKGFR